MLLQVLRGSYGFSKSRSYLCIKTTMIFRQVCCFNLQQGLAVVKPVKQMLRRFSKRKQQAMGEELAKLLEVGIIKEIKHLDWLANLAMVPKKDKS